MNCGKRYKFFLARSHVKLVLSAQLALLTSTTVRFHGAFFVHFDPAWHFVLKERGFPRRVREGVSCSCVKRELQHGTRFTGSLAANVASGKTTRLRLWRRALQLRHAPLSVLRSVAVLDTLQRNHARASDSDSPAPGANEAASGRRWARHTAAG